MAILGVVELDAGEPHPAIGSGLQMRLMLPVEPDPMIAQKLNANECLEPDAHQLGAWCVDERGLHFAGFVPAAAYMPGLSRALASRMSARNDWARALLFPAGYNASHGNMETRKRRKHFPNACTKDRRFENLVLCFCVSVLPCDVSTLPTSNERPTAFCHPA